MNDKHAHIAEVYMCFLPFQRNQWIQTTNEVLNQMIEKWYDSNGDPIQSDDIVIEIGNPKRHTMEDLLNLNERITTELRRTDYLVIVDMSVLAKYFKQSWLDLLYWTIKADNKLNMVIGYFTEVPRLLTEKTLQFDSLNVEKLSDDYLQQLLPASIQHQSTLTVYEYRPEQKVEQVIIMEYSSLTLPLLIALDSTGSSTAVVIIDGYKELKGHSISRAGIRIEYEDKQALIFDALHYSFQYQAQPIFIEPTGGHYIELYGAALNLTRAACYRTATPHTELFSSRNGRDQLLAEGRIDLTNNGLQQMADYYNKPFSLLKLPVLLPIYSLVEVYKSMLLTKSQK